jgi:hypothetical protein
MKRRYMAIIAAFAVGLALTLPGADKQADGSSPPGSNERFESEVLRVFSAKDGDALFRAYVVKWKGQEVVASDPLVKTDYRVGDTITVLAINLPFPEGKAGPRLLSFHVPPKQ